MSDRDLKQDIEKFDKTSDSISSNGYATYTREEEKRLVRKLDFRIVPVVIILYLANFIDRTNIGNAKVAGLETDLGLKGYEYNIGLSIFYILYSLSEVPSNLILKKVGADVWIPTLVLGFGIISLCTTFIHNFGGFMTVRALLGMMEVAYYLSTYYRRHELVLRVCIFVSASSISGAFGGLLAYGLLQIKQLYPLRHGIWRNIFLVEGVITIALALAGYMVLPGPKERAEFLTEREREIALARLAADAPAKEDPNVKGDAWYRAFKSLNTWMCGIMFLLNNMSVQGISLFMPALMKGLGYTTIKSQLMTVPVYIVASVWSIFVAYGSLRTRKRALWMLITTPLAIIGLTILLATADKKTNYAAVFLVASGVFPQGPIVLVWATNNAEPSTVRAVSSAMVVSIGSLGPIVSSWIYLGWDAPRYKIANATQLGAQCVIFCLILMLLFHNIHENRRRERGDRDYRLRRSPEDVARLGNLHPQFKMQL